MLAAISAHRSVPVLHVAASPDLIRRLGSPRVSGEETLRRMLQAWALRRADLLPDVRHVSLSDECLEELRSLYTADTAALVRRMPLPVETL